MTRARWILAIVVVLAALGAWTMVVHVPGGAAAVIESGRAGEPPRPLAPGLHIKSFGSTVTIYEQLAANDEGTVIVPTAAGGEIQLRYRIDAELDPSRIGDLHRAIGGRPLEEFFGVEVANRLRDAAAEQDPLTILTPGFREESASSISRHLLEAGFARADLSFPAPDDGTILEAVSKLAPLGQASPLRLTVTSALEEEGRSGSWRLHTALGMINESEKLFAEAEKNYLDALAIDPVALPPMSQLVTLYSAVSEYDKLQRILDAALTVDPNSVQHINWVGMVFVKKQDYAQAERFFRKGLDLDPGHSTFLANMGALYLKTGREGEAVEFFRRAVESAPTNQQALFNLGSALASSGNYDEALPFLERAEASGRMNRALARTLGLVHERLGHRREAAEYLRRAKELDVTGKGPPSG